MRNAGGGSARANSTAGPGSDKPSTAAEPLLSLLRRVGPAAVFTITDASRRASHCCSCLRLSLPLTVCSVGPPAAGAGDGVSGPSVVGQAGVPASCSQDSFRYLAAGTGRPPGVVGGVDEHCCWSSCAESASTPIDNCRGWHWCLCRAKQPAAACAWVLPPMLVVRGHLIYRDCQLGFSSCVLLLLLLASDDSSSLLQHASQCVLFSSWLPDWSGPSCVTADAMRAALPASSTVQANLSGSTVRVILLLTRG
jgi:hypothetical protein